MEEEIIQNSVQIIALGTLSMVTVIGGILFFIILYQKKVHKAEQEKKELENEYQKGLLSSFIETQEKERQRIAADLHDGVGASLSGIKLMLNQLKPQNDTEKEALTECTTAIQNTASNVRGISHNLLPPSLQTLGLAKVLERMAKNYTSDELSVDFSATLATKIDQKTELALFRIAQELINNTIKHAEATEVSIELKGNEDFFHFEYADNGKGFEVKAADGLGLRNIKSRVQMIEGELNFFSEAKVKNGLTIKVAKHG